MPKKLLSALKERWYDMIDSDASPHQIALSFAVGTFIELLPAFGLKTMISLGVLTAFRSLNRLALLAAIALWNSFLLAPIYGVSYSLGIKYLKAPDCGAFSNPLQAPSECLTSIFLPSVVVASIVIASLTYIVLWLAMTWRRNRRLAESASRQIQCLEPAEVLMNN